MRSLMMTGTAIATLLAGVVSVSAQTGGVDELRRPNAGQEQRQGGPGRSEAAPGQDRRGAGGAPGRSESAPAQNRRGAEAAPGASDSAPGRNRPGATGAAGGGAGDDSRITEELRRDRNRNAEGAAGERDRDRRQAQDRDGRRPGEGENLRRAEDGDARDRDRNRRAEDGDARDRDRNRQAQDRDGQNRRDGDARRADERDGADRDRNRQARDDDRGGRGDAKLSIKLKGDEKAKVTANLIQRADRVDRTKIKFKINVGTRVPRDEVRFYTLPPTIVSIVPQYSGYRYFVVEDEIVIVQPDTYEIVEVIDRGGSGATGSARLVIDSSKFGVIKSKLDRHGDVKVKLTVREGELLPEAVSLWDIPSTVVAEVPELRSYRYVYYNDEVLVVEPDSRRIVEVIR